jgi:hypothetical protein
MNTELRPIMDALVRWLEDHYDPGLDPVCDERAQIHSQTRLVIDQLERLHTMVKREREKETTWL